MKKEKHIEKEEKRVRSKKRVFLRFLVFAASVFILLPIVFVFAFYLAFVNKVYPGVFVSDISLSNKSVDEAQGLISHLEEKTPENLTLKYGGKTWEIKLFEISYHIRARETANKAFGVGRSRNVGKDVRDIYEAWRWGRNIPIDYLIDEKALTSKLASIFTEVFVPAVDPKIEVTIDNKTGRKIVNVIPGEEGRELERDKAIVMVRGRLSGFDFSPLDLPIHPINPSFGATEVEKTRERAEKLLGKMLSLTFEDYIWNLEDSELLDFLAFDGSYSTEKIANYAISISRAIERTPQNAAFQFSNNRVTLFRPAKDGVTLDIDKFTEKIVENLVDLGKSEEKLSISIPVKKTRPPITTESVNNLGIKELIGRGYSTFKGSIPSRVHNIVLASSKINGTLIAPGEVFSFNKTLGEVSGATGFQQAYIIKEGRTVLGDGGGVCQVSTTLFRAALNSGLPIEERWAHSYRVSYYEQGFGPGLDATVYDPGYDLKIKNNTSSHILIQAYTDTVAMRLTFDLYGTSDGRVSFVSKPKIWSETPPPPDLYQDDPTLPLGTIKQIDFKAWGAKVSFEYKVTRGNEILQQKTFYSNFSPWRAIFLRGTRP